MKVSEMIGKPIVGMSDGEKVGVVKDVYLDPDQLKATAILMGGSHGKGLMPFESIKAIGADAVTIESAQGIQWVTGQLSNATGRQVADLKKLPVVDGAGTEIGTVDDVDIDPATGQVVAMHVSGGGVFGIGAHRTEVSAGQIRAIGPAIITAEVPPAVPAA